MKAQNVIPCLLAIFIIGNTSPAPAQFNELWYGSKKGPQFQGLERETCSFACESIPNPGEVLLNFGRLGFSQLAAAKLNLVVWNIYKSRNDGWFEHYRELDQWADLILFQEVMLDDPTQKALTQSASFNWNLATAFFMKNEVRTGVATGARSEVLSATTLITADREPLVKSPKAMMITLYNWAASAQPLMVVNIHGINKRGIDGLMRHLQLAVPYVREHKGPVIFAGDFNTHKANYVEAADNLLNPLGLKRILWPTDNRQDQRDHVYYRGVKIVNPDLDESVTTSDHPLLRLEILPE